MEEYKQQFIEFMVRSNVLTFGDFVTKSGRKTPFFINAGNYSTGEQLVRLGQYYAAALRQNLGDAVDVLFGPAYKGIPLAVTTATALFNLHGQNVSFCFNRKEAKDHGEGGILVGRKLRDGDRIVIVEDVTTAGTSVRESIPLLTGAAKVTLAGLVVSVDRMERGTGPAQRTAGDPRGSRHQRLRDRHARRDHPAPARPPNRRQSRARRPDHEGDHRIPCPVRRGESVRNTRHGGMYSCRPAFLPGILNRPHFANQRDLDLARIR